MKIIEKPKPGEYPPYAEMYIKLIPGDGNLSKHLADNLEATKKFILSLPEEKLSYRYADGKWDIKEVMLHIIDDERIFAYRILRFARNDKTELPGFEQDDFAKYSFANRRSIQTIFEEFESVRRATITLIDSLEDEILMNQGTCNGYQTNVRSLAYHLAGHELHHINIIKEKYL
ncbi:MAG TPA: DinB family protein [Puia sp.]|nr:DinB family protein [Puia sp.]